MTKSSFLGFFFKDGVGRTLAALQLLTFLNGSLVALYYHFKPTTNEILSEKIDVLTKIHSALDAGVDKKDVVTFLVSDGFSLTGQNFQGYDLSEIDTPDADFSYSTISALNFNNANLQSANFTGATVVNTDFSYANLSNATFDSYFYLNSDTGGGDQFTGAILPKDFDFSKISQLACTRKKNGQDEIYQAGNPEPLTFKIVPFQQNIQLKGREIETCKSEYPEDQPRTNSWSPNNRIRKSNTALIILLGGVCGALTQVIRLAFRRQNTVNADQVISFTYKLIFGFIIGLCLTPIYLWDSAPASPAPGVLLSHDQVLFIFLGSYFLTNTLDGIFERLFLKNSATATPSTYHPPAPPTSPLSPHPP